MKTSYYAVTPSSTPGSIAISRSTPANTSYLSYPKLAPSKNLLSDWKYNGLSQPEYCDRFYKETLYPLNPQQTWDELHEIAGDAESILLCYEAIKGDLLDMPAIELPRKNFCHRRIVAEWFHEWLGVSVPEVGRREAIVQGGLFGKEDDW